MYVLQRTFGLIGQKVIYISIPLVARVKRRAAFIHLPSEKAHSRKLTVASLATNIPFYSGQSSVSPLSCCLLPGHSYTCCEDLLGGATPCCSRAAGELVSISFSVCVGIPRSDQQSLCRCRTSTRQARTVVRLQVTQGDQRPALRARPRRLPAALRTSPGEGQPPLQTRCSRPRGASGTARPPC